MTPNSLWHHVRRLAAKLGAEVWICDSCDPGERPDGTAHVADGEGWVNLTHVPNTRRAYLLALHELGHLSAVQGQRVKFRTFRNSDTLGDEAKAWRWALAQAQIELRPEDWADIHWWIKTYADDRRYKRSPDFDRLLTEAERHACTQST